MKILYTILFTFLGLNLYSQNIDSSRYSIDIKYFKADSIVFCNFNINPSQKGASIILKYTRIKDKIKKFQLDSIQSKDFIQKLNDKFSFGLGTMSCFEPHIGVLFYKDGYINAYIDICLDCNRLNASFKIPAQLQGKQESEGYVYYTLDGMSKSFRRFLNELIKPHNFSHQLDYQSELDK